MFDLVKFDSLLRIIIIVELIWGLFVWMYCAKRFRLHYKYSLAPILYICHALLFVGLTVFNILPRNVYTIWRDILFIHGLLLLNIIGIVFIQVFRTRE